MPASSSLAGLISWLGRDEWREPFEEVLWLHVGPACEQVGLEIENLEDTLGRHHFMTLWGCAFEDFLTRALEPDGRNVVDDYLRRRGWKETAPNRRYMQALRSSTMSLYEVSGIVPGEAFLARDLLRGGEPVRVSERTATKTLAPWERIAARLVGLDGKLILAGGVLPFAHEAADEAVRVFKAARTRARREMGKLAKAEGAAAGEARPDAWAVERLVLEGEAPVFTNLWLADVLLRVMDPSPPVLVNSEGDEIAFHTVRYAFRSGTTADVVRERLRTVEAFQEASESFWNWGKAEGAPKSRGAGRRGAKPATNQGRTWSVTLDGGGVLGNVELAGDAVSLSANSRSRAERGQALLTPLLGELVRAPLTGIQTVEQMMASRPDRREPAAPADEISPDVRAGIVHESLDNHYRAALDQPLAMLGGKTPRACARTKAGREKVAGWLKFLESQNGRGRDGDDRDCPDFGGYAACAHCGPGPGAGSNSWPKPEPNAPL